MVVTNLSLFREYQQIINLVNEDIRYDFLRFDVKNKIIKSQFVTAWKDMRRVFSNLCCDSNTSLADRKRVSDFCSKVYSHTSDSIEEAKCQILQKTK
jgi:hypothetical protein